MEGPNSLDTPEWTPPTTIPRPGMKASNASLRSRSTIRTWPSNWPFSTDLSPAVKPPDLNTTRADEIRSPGTPTPSREFGIRRTDACHVVAGPRLLEACTSKRTKISAVRLVRGQKEDGRPSDVWSTTEGQLCLKSQIAGHGGPLPRPDVVETIRIWWD